jgi:putative endonuclease
MFMLVSERSSSSGVVSTPSRESRHSVYVIECADGTLYTGYTTDVERRVDEHDAGEGAKYTRGRTPVTLRHVESFDSRSAAMSREHAIKSLTRTEKEALIESDSD